MICQQSLKSSKPTSFQKRTELIQKVSLEFTRQFFDVFETLGAKEKRIFEFLQYHCNKWSTMFYSQSNIAKFVGCSREHVNRTVKKFVEFNWIAVVSRGSRKSKIVLMDELLFSVNLKEKSLWKRVEITRDITLSIPFNQVKELGLGAREKEKKKIEDRLRNLNIPKKFMLRLQAFPLFVVESALKECKNISASKLISEGKNPHEYMVGICFNKARQQGVIGDWKWLREQEILNGFREGIA